ncbi:MAG: S8 family serine peptidase [Candidatus Krumholzibacteriia bacterium]
MLTRLLVFLLVGMMPGLVLAADLDRAQLDAIRMRAEARLSVAQGAEFQRLRAVQTGPMGRLNRDPRLSLMAVLPTGRPMFYTIDNLDAAISIGTDRTWPGGSTGLNLVGANTAGELAIWDGGVVRTTHQEFGGRVTVADGSTNLGDHATHVAGTLVAAGVDPQAHGMSPAAFLQSYYWDDDEAEMAAAAAAGLRVSNHSYGWVVGWLYGFNGDANWYWFGDPTVSQVEDPGFGFYADGTALWDEIAHAAPGYLIVKSAGNDRDDFGPGPGGGHYAWDAGANDWAWSTTTRNADGGPDGYDSIGYRGNAKNILTVGAVEDVPGGWSSPDEVTASAFTSWGPTDDGRIKPDLVTNGVALYSSLAGSNTSYGWYSGTSMAAPAAAGSLNLLLQHYEAAVGATPLASTLKAIVLHTADEAGVAAGPDYSFGWGLMNTARAAELVADHAAGGRRVHEGVLTAGQIDRLRFHHDGSGTLVFTLVWTDVPGTPAPWSVDPPDPMLVNDLDLRVIRESDGAVLEPWILDPANPAAPATTGPNHRDNVETVDASGAGAGTYLVEIGHTGALTGDQAYSLVQTGGRAISVTAVDDRLPARGARLLGAAPNPFNPRTEIRLAMAAAGQATVTVFDARGRRVADLFAGRLDQGEHRLGWDGRDRDGRALPAGLYLVRLRTATGFDSLRVSLVK